MFAKTQYASLVIQVVFNIVHLGFTPNFAVGCRRLNPGDPYMLAIQKPNVDVHFTPVVQITEYGLIGEDGTEKKVDTIVCATGFDVPYRPRFPLVGQGGVDLRDKWKVCPEGYLGLAIPGYGESASREKPGYPVSDSLGSLTTYHSLVLPGQLRM